MKWIVAWVVINTWTVPCGGIDQSWVDEYGRNRISSIGSLALCYESDTTDMARTFKSESDAKAFVSEMNEICERQVLGCDFQNIKLYKAEVQE